MKEFLPFIITGLATGAIYGLFASGLVLTYKTSGIFNFAHGAIATAAAYVFYFLHVDQGLHWLAALVISVFVVGPLVGLVFERMAARLALQRTVHKVVGTIGVVLLVQALAVIKYGSNTIRLLPFLPGGRTTAFTLAGVVVGWDRVIVAAVSVFAVALLYLLFRATRLGTAMRAVVDDPDLLAMQGTNPVAVRRIAWIIGSCLAALSGVLITEFVGVDNIALTFLVVQALGAAAVGAFTSIPLTFLGALLIGVAADISKKYVLNISWLSGFPDALPFLVLFVALLVIPRRKLVPPSTVAARPPMQYRAPARVRAGAAVLVLVPLLFVPQLVGTNLSFFVAGLCTAMLVLSLGLLVRTSGQVSLCHATFAAIGAVAFSQLNTDHGVPWLLALLIAGLVAVPVGALVAIPAMRLSGLFLAVATLGFGVLVQKLLYSQGWMFTSLAQGRVANKPGFASSLDHYYYVVLAAVVATAIVVTLINRSRLGRLLQGMAGSPTAVTSMGLSTNMAKVIVFCTSAFFAGISGALLGVARGNVIGGDTFFFPFASLVLLAVLAIAPLAEPWYAIVPAVAVVIPAYVTGGNTSNWLNAIFGLSAVLIAVRGGYAPMPERLRSVLDRVGGRRDLQRPAAGAIDLSIVADRAGHGIEVESLEVRFGGLTAVEGISFTAPLGRITGLIGPNGAGKTTSFDACSGLNRRYEGTVRLNGVSLASASPAARARAGLGRTFQRMELCDTLTVFDNVLLGRESSQAGARVRGQLVASAGQRREAQGAAWSALELCGVDDLAEQQAGALSTGQRRLVELARCLAGPFEVLLLDEPSSGLDHEETSRFGALLQRVVAERGVGILLVEHDMELVMRVCDHIYVLDFGKMIFEGSPPEIMASEMVQAAYLGSDDVMTAGDLGKQVAPT